jgi:hypothetical protein
MGKRGGRDHPWAGAGNDLPGAKWRNGLTMEKIRMKAQPPPMRTLADMTEPEICAIEREYGCPVIRPSSVRFQETEQSAGC